MQLRIFLICLFIGVLGGFVYDVFFLLRNFYRKQWFRVLCDVCFCLCFGVFYFFLSVSLALPPLRGYHLLACVIGLTLYLKSFHKIVAFFADMLYNKLIGKHKRNTKHGRSNKRAKAG